jgi:hypothetical protein
MVRRQSFLLLLEDICVGAMDIVWTRIHEADTRWLILQPRAIIPGEMLGPTIFELVPSCRIALLQVICNWKFFQPTPDFAYEGHLPGSKGEEVPVYSVRQDRVPKGRFRLLQASLQDCRTPRIDAEFYALKQSGRTIGVTGYYITDLWPLTGWGAWGALHPKAAGFHAALTALKTTEEQIYAKGCEWFCVESSSARAYRAARRLYQIYGLQELLNVPYFFRDESGRPAISDYLIYGRRIRSKPEKLAQ